MFCCKVDKCTEAKSSLFLWVSFIVVCVPISSFHHWCTCHYHVGWLLTTVTMTTFLFTSITMTTLLFTSRAAYYIVIYFHCYHDYLAVYKCHHDDLVVCRFERGNVLAIFSSSIVVVLAAMTIVKHSMERLFDPPVINT